MLKKIIQTAFIFIVSTFYLYSMPGSGTETDPYQIWNKADLEAIADSVYYNPHDAPMVNWSSDKCFILMADITDTVRYTIACSPTLNFSFFFV